ncbi:MAG: endonuclease/exonuclease/phosphatase family protein [Phycisphaerales bacterium]
MMKMTIQIAIALSCTCSFGGHGESESKTQPVALRIATFNVEDVRGEQLVGDDDPRLRQIAAILQRIRPNIVLLNEIETGQEDGPSNAEKFAYNYLAVSQGEGLRPLFYETYTPATNTGVHSGFDLDNSGTIETAVPEQSEQQTDAQRVYGNDCYGFGTYPGQYGMALLVDRRLRIESEGIRTLREFLWKDLPGANPPKNSDGSDWYDADEWDSFRLASKTFADVPIQLPNGTVLHALISHPTPPAFDGEEQRNKLRNHDEIRLIRAYIDNEAALYDDSGVSGGLEDGSQFVILGDLNADPSDGSSLEMTIFSQLFTSSKLARDAHPGSLIEVDRLDRTDTARFGLRVDYVLPSAGITITESGVWRESSDADTPFPSDHFPVWADVIVP